MASSSLERLGSPKNRVRDNSESEGMGKTKQQLNRFAPLVKSREQPGPFGVICMQNGNRIVG
jgi:hypothetical protein